MKRLITFGFICFLLFTASHSADWTYKKLGGGNAVKMIVMDNEGGPKGVWFFSKDGGTYWLPWDETIGSYGDWGDWQCFDEHFGWHMGGDTAYVDTTHYAMAGTMQGINQYSYNPASGWDNVDPPGLIRNSYYYYRDAMFVKDTEAGSWNTAHYIVSCWQHYSPPTGTIRQGLYIIDDEEGMVNAFPVVETRDHLIKQLHRDFDADTVYYFWGTIDYQGSRTYGFWKLVVTGQENQWDCTISKDFDDSEYIPKEVNRFYQYKDDSGVIHQYLLIKRNPNETDTWDIFYRNDDSGFSDDWGDPIWASLEDELYSTPGGGIVGRRHGDDHYIFLVGNNEGLVLFDTGQNIGVNNPKAYYLDSDGDYLTVFGSHCVTWVPWADDGDSDHHIIFGAPGTGNTFTEIDIDSWPPSNSDIDIYDMHGFSANEEDAKGAPGGRNRGMYYEGRKIYIPTWGEGVWLGDFNGASPKFNKILANLTPWSTAQTDFSFSWNCCGGSPWDSKIFFGALNVSYYIDGIEHTDHTGLWSYDESGQSLEQIWDGNPVWSLAAGGYYLYIGAEEAGSDAWWVAELYYKEEESDPVAIFDTDDPNYSHSVPGWGNIYAEFLSLQPHPNQYAESGIYEGVVCGLGIRNIDWGSYYYAPGVEDLDQWGGGIVYFYKDEENSSWNEDPEVVVPMSQSGDPPGDEWFEHVFDMVVECNEDYYTGISENHKKMDILAATCAWQLERSTEDVWRYGGLFEVHWDPTGAGSWVIRDVTPCLASGTPLYQLDGYEDFDDHAAVMAVESYNSPIEDTQTLYICTTSGEQYGTEDEHYPLVWYQKADDMRGLTRTGWKRYPSAWGEENAGRIPYDATNNKFFSNWFCDVAILDWGTLYVGGHYIENSYVGDDLDGNETWSGNVMVWDDIVVGEGDTLNLDKGLHVFMMDTCSITIDGGYINIMYPDSARILFSSSEDLRWKGLIFKDIPGDTLLSVENLEIRNAKYGIFVDNSTTGNEVRLQIDNCLFDGNYIGIAADRARRIIVQNCEIKKSVREGHFNGDGIYLFNLPASANHNIMNSKIHDNEGCGIRIINCGSTLSLFNNELHDNLGQNDGTPSSWSGIYFYNSTPKLSCNEVYESRGYPLATTNSAAPYFCHGPDSTNIFELDTQEADTFAVLWANGGFPVLNNARNNFSHNDCDSLCLVKDFTSPQVGRRMENNWWGVNPPSSSQFYDANYMDYDPYLASVESFPTGLPERGIYTPDAYEVLDEALIALYDGQYQEAYDALTGLIENFPDAEDAISLALPHILNAGAQTSISLSTLYNYFDNIHIDRGGSLVGKTARKVRNDCALLMQNYTDALADYESIINSPGCLTDSVFALIDANQVSLIMNSLPGIQSAYQPTALNPVNFQNYVRRETELLALLGSDGRGSSAGVLSLPVQYALRQNYPNPFNSTTIIKYDLPELSDVKIEVFNIRGQKVVSLTDGILQPGFRALRWNGVSDHGVNVASGVYIYRIEARGKITGAKFTKCKKMTLLK